MSAKVSGAVWDLELPHNEKLVLLAMADHADHNGNNVYPSLRLIAWKTDYDERQVRRIVDILETKGVLVVCERRLGHTTVYSINLQAVPQKSSFTAVRGRPRTDGTQPQTDNKTPVTMSPVYAKPLTPSNKTPDIWDNKPLTSGTKTPDILDACIYDAGALDLEPSIEPSIEKNKRGETPCARPAKVERIRKKDNVLTGVHVAINPPTLDEIKAWLTEHKHDPRHAVAFFSHYGANGWYQNGGKPVYSWPHALAGWVDREKQFDNGARQTSRSSTPLVGGTLANAGHVQVKRPADWKPITLEEATRRDKEYAAQVAAKRQADALRNGS